MKTALYIVFTLVATAALVSCVYNNITIPIASDMRADNHAQSRLDKLSNSPTVANCSTIPSVPKAIPIVQPAPVKVIVPVAPKTTSQVVPAKLTNQSPANYRPPTISRTAVSKTASATSKVIGSSRSSEQYADPKKVCLRFNLSTQTGSCAYDDLQVYTFSFSSGKMGYDTPTGTFFIGAKDPMKWSTQYKCWMPLFMNLGITDADGLDRGIGAHEGRVPEDGYPASHRCIRLKSEVAKKLYRDIPTGSRVVITGDAKDYYKTHFPGYHLLTFDSSGVPKIKRNADGSLTKEFIDYTINNKMEVYTRSPSGKKVDKEQGVLSFEFMEDPWQQGVSVKDYRRALSGN